MVARHFRDGGFHGRGDFFFAHGFGHVVFNQHDLRASLSAISWRPPFWNCSMESRRCLISVLSTCKTSPHPAAALVDFLVLERGFGMRKVEAGVHRGCAIAFPPCLSGSVR